MKKLQTKTLGEYTPVVRLSVRDNGNDSWVLARPLPHCSHFTHMQILTPAAHKRSSEYIYCLLYAQAVKGMHRALEKTGLRTDNKQW